MNTQYREEARGKKADTRKQKHQTSDFYLSNEFHTDVQRSFGLFHFVCRAGDQTQGLAHARQRSVVELHPQPLVLLRVLLCSSGWPRTHGDLHPTPDFWDYRCVAPCPAIFKAILSFSIIAFFSVHSSSISVSHAEVTEVGKSVCSPKELSILELQHKEQENCCDKPSLYQSLLPLSRNPVRTISISQKS
jgi:hypothetical protein